MWSREKVAGGEIRHLRTYTINLLGLLLTCGFIGRGRSCGLLGDTGLGLGLG